ncbi:hypothetical protein [Type-D symbiont of Plautia stali]|uniref:hypothetical protein n=1 Tax=Type-D symbiont of Plautia stali TaxID=1560356 RepID=UPI0009E8D8EE|nr:hypothetical protein [Type-D symbiont of Plautia stali]
MLCFYHDDEKGQTIIGEAAIVGLDITAESLIKEFAAIAEADVSDEKLAEIFDARRSLQGFRQYGSRQSAELHWMTMTGLENDG